MIIIIFQLLTVIFLFIMLILLGFLSKGKKNDRTGKAIWTIECDRAVAGSSDTWRHFFFRKNGVDKVDIPEGTFYLGNNIILDDIVIDTKKKIRLYLNVQTNQILVTVLEGTIRVNESFYEQDKTKQINLHDHMAFFINGIKIILKRKGR